MGRRGEGKKEGKRKGRRGREEREGTERRREGKERRMERERERRTENMRRPPRDWEANSQWVLVREAVGKGLHQPAFQGHGDGTSTQQPRCKMAPGKESKDIHVYTCRAEMNPGSLLWLRDSTFSYMCTYSAPFNSSYHFSANHT